MNIEAIIKRWAGIKSTGLEKWDQLHLVYIHLLTAFKELCGYGGIWNVFALMKWMFSLNLEQWGKEGSKNDLGRQEILVNKTQLCVCVRRCLLGETKAVGNILIFLKWSFGVSNLSYALHAGFSNINQWTVDF